MLSRSDLGYFYSGDIPPRSGSRFLSLAMLVAFLAGPWFDSQGNVAVLIY